MPDLDTTDEQAVAETLATIDYFLEAITAVRGMKARDPLRMLELRLAVRGT
jgi:hypothetical protein